MNSLSFSASVDERASGAGDLLRRVHWLLWQCIRVPAFLLLSILEPLVSFVLSALALLPAIRLRARFTRATVSSPCNAGSGLAESRSSAASVPRERLEG